MLTDLELTEDEESDTLIMRERRKANQGGHLEMVKQAMGQGGRQATSIYQPDERSKAWAKSISSSPSLCKIKVTTVTGRKGDISRPDPQKVLALIQYDEVKEGRSEETLHDGLLQIWQFSAFKQDSLLRPYNKEQFVRDLLSKFKLGATRKHALSGYNYLLKAIREFLGPQVARQQFKIHRHQKQIDL